MMAQEAAGLGHNGYLEPAEWAWQAAQSKAHSLVKLVVHTLRCLMKDGEQEANVSDERLAELTSLTVKSVRKYRKQAHDEGWINHRAGRGRGHNSTYQMVIPSRTLSQLSALIDIDKSRNEMGTFNKTTNEKATLERVPLEGKVPAERVPLEEKWEREGTLSGSNHKKEISPHTPLKEKIINNNPPTPQTARKGGDKGDPFGLNLHRAAAHRDVWFDDDARLQVCNGFKGELAELAGGEPALRIELDRAGEWIGPNTPPDILKAKVRGRVQSQIAERKDRDARYAKASKKTASTTSPIAIPTEKPDGMPDSVWRKILADRAAKARC